MHAPASCAQIQPSCPIKVARFSPLSHASPPLISFAYLPCGTQDVNLTADYKLKQKLAKGGITANAKYELGPKFYTAGATWDGPLANKTTMLKG